MHASWARRHASYAIRRTPRIMRRTLYAICRKSLFLTRICQDKMNHPLLCRAIKVMVMSTNRQTEWELVLGAAKFTPTSNTWLSSQPLIYLTGEGSIAQEGIEGCLQIRVTAKQLYCKNESYLCSQFLIGQLLLSPHRCNRTAETISRQCFVI